MDYFYHVYLYFLKHEHFGCKDFYKLLSRLSLMGLEQQA